MANKGKFKGYGRGFKQGDNRIQSEPRPRYVMRITLKDIAEARGCHIDTVRRAISSGKLDMNNLLSISQYVVRHAGPNN